MPKIHILVIDDEFPIVHGIKTYFDTLEEFQISTATSPVEGWKMLKNNHYDILIIDLRMPETDGLALIRKIRKKEKDLEIFVISGHANVDDVISCYKEGVLDFFQKPFELITLANAIKKTSRYIELHNALSKTKEELCYLQFQSKNSRPNQIIGKSPAIKKVREMMHKIAGFSDMTVIIEGESGTGKELVALGIHQLSARSNHHFVAVNCASIPEHLFESEFFGYTKGSFTGATESKYGYIQYAQNGTLFLDEIGEMPVNQQSKLLRLLETKKFHQVGRAESLTSDIRVMAASNKPLKQLTADKRIREDLYYRLNQFTIEVPPLRERTTDIPVLFDYFVQTFCEKHKHAVLDIDQGTYALLREYPYPGNIRELKNIAERAIILTEGNTIMPSALPFTIPVQQQGITPAPRNLSELEKSTIEQAIAVSNQSRKKTSEILGITPQTLDRKMAKHGITWNKRIKM